jgi:virulence-associated protein VapD
VGYAIIPHINRKDKMYIVLQKLTEDYFTVEKVRKPIKTFDEAVAKVKALKVLDDEDSTTYIITQKVDNDTGVYDNE